MRRISEDSVGIKRKCGCCGEYFYINKNNICEAIYYDNKTYHSSCFINICEKRSKNKRKDISQKWTQIYENIELIKEDTRLKLLDAIERNDIFEFIKEAYDLTIIPSTVWQKLSNIYAGTFKGMTVGIPPSHLLDMWKKKINILNGIASKNESKGVHLEPDQRLNYDLSVLVNKYDSYLKWLEKEKINNLEQTQDSFDNIVGTIIGYNKSVLHKSDDDLDNNDMNDISSLVDDIFD